jgi:hypothetical protein
MANLSMKIGLGTRTQRKFFYDVQSQNVAENKRGMKQNKLIIRMSL